MSSYEPFAQGLKVLQWTDPTPGLPLITSKGNNAKLVFTAVEQAIAQLQEGDRELLGIKGIVSIPQEAYLAIENPPES